MLNKILTPIGALGAVIVAFALAAAPPAPPAPAGSPGASPDSALAALKAGNERFVAGKSSGPNRTLERVKDVSAGQHPYACIMTCADSRVPPELCFDAGFGDLFICRGAGVAGTAIDTASLEYGTQHLGAKVIVVMGHSNCGALDACLQNADLHGSLPILMSALRPAVDEAVRQNPGATPAVLLAAAIKQQVWDEVEQLIVGSSLINGAVRGDTVKVVGAYYDTATAKIEWMGEHPNQKQLLNRTSDTMH